MTNFVDIGEFDSIPPRAARVVKTAFGCIAVFRNSEGKVFAIDDKCPHKGGPLSNGIQHGEKITCPLHNWVFDLNTGVADGPDEGSVNTYPVKIEDGRILLDTDSFATRVAAE